MFSLKPANCVIGAFCQCGDFVSGLLIHRLLCSLIAHCLEFLGLVHRPGVAVVVGLPITLLDSLTLLR